MPGFESGAEVRDRVDPEAGEHLQTAEGSRVPYGTVPYHTVTKGVGFGSKFSFADDGHCAALRCASRGAVPVL